jgi:hypothetical protein
LKGEWDLHFVAGGPELPAPQKLPRLLSWTALPDKTGEAFSGTAAYTFSFNLPAKTAPEYLLDLGIVRESARVWLNGHEVGYLWSFPFRARVGAYLKKGRNTLRLEVVNLMANRIRYLDQHQIEWRKFHEINFVNIKYKPFDATAWEPVASGLLGPVTLTPYQITPNKN